MQLAENVTIIAFQCFRDVENLKGYIVNMEFGLDANGEKM